jgi:hypothetical protein
MKFPLLYLNTVDNFTFKCRGEDTLRLVAKKFVVKIWTLLDSKSSL